MEFDSSRFGTEWPYEDEYGTTISGIFRNATSDEGVTDVIPESSCT